MRTIVIAALLIGGVFAYGGAIHGALQIFGIQATYWAVMRVVSLLCLGTFLWTGAGVERKHAEKARKDER